MSNHTDNPTLQSEKLEPCRWCEKGDRANFLDEDGTLVSITGNDGILSHAYDDMWWPCLKFGVELHCSRAPIVAPQGGDALESRDFFDLMQNYRHASAGNQAIVCERFEAVKAFIRAASSPASSPRHYFIVTQTRDKCGYSGCELGPLDHPEVPKHNTPAATPTPVEQERDE